MLNLVKIQIQKFISKITDLFLVFPDTFEKIHIIESYPKYLKNWQDSGAENESEYQVLIQDGCGVACLRTILAYYHKEVPLPIPLLKALRHLGIFGEGGMILKKVSKSLAEYNLKAKYFSHLSLKKLAKLVTEKPVICSIKNAESGHLVVVFGIKIFDEKPDEFIIYDSEKDQVLALKNEEFKKISNNRALQIVEIGNM